MVAAWPIQRGISRGSTSSFQTVSGLAAITISRSTRVVSVAMSIGPPVLSFRLVSQSGEAVVPEFLEKALELHEGLRPGSVEAPRPVPALAQQPGLLEPRQVVRARGGRDVEMHGDLARRELVRPHERENLPPPRLRNRSQGGVHG